MVTHVRPRMGTLLAVTLPARGVPGTPDWSTAFGTATAWERVMSHHAPTSDVSRLNRLAGDPIGLISRRLAAAIAVGRGLAERTGGAFDPTIAPLARLWQDAARRRRPPSARQVERARRPGGRRAVTIDRPPGSLAAAGKAVHLRALGQGVTPGRIPK